MTDQKFYITGYLKFFRKWVEDHGRKYERVMAILEIENNDQSAQFFEAWLPETSSEYFELVGLFGGPINSPCRLAIQRGPNEKSQKHHLIVMSKGVEDIMVDHMKEGTRIQVEILPEGEKSELIADGMIDSNGSYDLIDGQMEF